MTLDFVTSVNTVVTLLNIADVIIIIVVAVVISGGHGCCKSPVFFISAHMVNLHF
jgi:hypothetical protein